MIAYAETRALWLALLDAALDQPAPSLELREALKPFLSAHPAVIRTPMAAQQSPRRRHRTVGPILYSEESSGVDV